eukprot:g33353.t1
MDKLTKFVKEQSLQRSERSARAEEQVQWLVELGGRGPKAAADFGFASQVANLTKDHNDEVAAAALRTLGDFGPEGAKHMGAVASGLNRSPEVCIAAAVALAEFGPQALGYGDTLAMCLERTRDENAKAAVLAALGAKLADPSKRFAAVTALGYLGTETVKRNMSQIVSCLKDKDSLTRQAAATTLGVASDAVLAGGDATSIVALLKDPNPGTRCAAALALGKLGAVSSAAEVYAPTNPVGSQDASESHLTVGGGALRSAAALRRPKCAALASLGLMKSEKHLPLLSGVGWEGALRDKSYEVRLSALEALMQVGHAAAKYSTSIMSVMEDDVYLVRLKACQTIAAIGATDDNLPDLFQDEAPSVRQAALDALATNSDIGKKYSSQVFKCITDEYGCVRAAAMRCLASMESLGDYGAAFTEEMEVCQHDEIPMVREAAAHALVKLGAKAGARGIENGSMICWTAQIMMFFGVLRAKQVKQVQTCLLNAGELLYLPSQWRHGTCNVGDFSAGIGYIGAIDHLPKVTWLAAVDDLSGLKAELQDKDKDEVVEALMVKDDRDGKQPLHWAAHRGHQRMVRELLKMRAFHGALDRHGARPVHLAAFEGHEKALRQLLEVETRKSAMARTEGGAEPLHLAATKGHTSVESRSHQTGVGHDGTGDVNGLPRDDLSSGGGRG